jgi:hypothetical protein
LNLRPSGYEPDELPDCSTPQQIKNFDSGWLRSDSDQNHYLYSFSAQRPVFLLIGLSPQQIKNLDSGWLRSDSDQNHYLYYFPAQRPVFLLIGLSPQQISSSCIRRNGHSPFQYTLVFSRNNATATKPQASSTRGANYKD